LNTIVPGDAVKITVILTSTINSSISYMTNSYFVPTFSDVAAFGTLNATVNVLISDADIPYINTLQGFNTYNYTLFITRNNET